MPALTSDPMDELKARIGASVVPDALDCRLLEELKRLQSVRGRYSLEELLCYAEELKAQKGELDRITRDRDAKSKRMWELGHECDRLHATLERIARARGMKPQALSAIAEKALEAGKQKASGESAPQVFAAAGPAVMSEERLDELRRTPRQADVADIEDLISEIDRTHAALRRFTEYPVGLTTQAVREEARQVLSVLRPNTFEPGVDPS